MSDGSSAPQFDDLNRTVKIPATRWWKRLLAFVGPAYMVSVGYVDPGNWATDVAAGSRFGYTLLWVLVMSSAMAVLLQTLSARLGLVTGRDLAQACRDEYPPPVRYVLFALTEIAIAATDLAEALGSAIALNLLFGIPILWAVIITAGDVLLLLVIQRFGIRKMEAVIVLLISVIGVCFIIEIFLSRPEWGGVLAGLRPGPMTQDQLYAAIGILGATLMPHNLYLHSSLVQSRDVARSREGVAQACHFNFIDSLVALTGAMLVNGAILITASAVFWTRRIEVSELQQAHSLLENLLGSSVAPVAFALALLASGQSSTVTGTLAGQITVEGFLRVRLRPWLQRLVTRLAAIIPAVIVVLLVGDGSVYRLLILSQVILGLQLPFAVVPLIKFTGSRRKMGPFASGPTLRAVAWLVTAAIIGLNVWLLYDQCRAWAAGAGPYGWLVVAGVIAVGGPLGALLGWMALRREAFPGAEPLLSPDDVAAAALTGQKRFNRIGVALEATETDAATLAEAVALAEVHGAELVLMHIVEGVGGQWYGPQTGDLESRADTLYLQALAERLGKDLAGRRIGGVRAALGFGRMPQGLVKLARAEAVDLLVMGGHGHRALGGIFHGETIRYVRHGLGIPVLAVRK
jgi:manganese transport protein